MSTPIELRRLLAVRLMTIAGCISTLAAAAGGCGNGDTSGQGTAGSGNQAGPGGPFQGQETECLPWPNGNTGGLGGMAGSGGAMGGMAGTGGGMGGMAGTFSMAGAGGAMGGGGGAMAATGGAMTGSGGAGAAGTTSGGGAMNVPPCPSRDQAAMMLQGAPCGLISVDTDGMFASGQCCYTTTVQYCVGRPFLVDDRPRVAALRVGIAGDWHAGAAPATAELPPAVRAALAEAWARDALLEHASVASFARFSLELLAVGAPADLVSRAHAAALDEVRHARLCFGLASAYDGAPLGPSTFPLPAALEIASDLVDIAARTVREGCVGETLSAVLASEQLAVATDPAVRAVLEIIAADEARHAELAWSAVAWAIDLGGEPVRAAALDAFDAAERELAAPAGEDSADAADLLAAHGRLPPRREAAARASALAEIVTPCARALLSRLRGAARVPAAPYARIV